jgi:gliding motility-associated transport system ATP-binding protein
LIEVKDLVKKYNNFLAVDQLSFTVNEGEILGFLGPNGAGKSTTMNIITGYISATEGKVLINGYDIFEEPEEAKKSIGYLPEQPPLYQDMTVCEYLNFVSDLKKVDKKEKKVMIAKIMDTTKIADISSRLIKHLSKGYKQRVGIAQALIGYPKILILDEPTVGLDPKQIIEIRQLIKDLSKKHTIILSSHILAEISAICDQIMIMNNGKLVVRDSPENLYKHFNGSNELCLLIKGDKKDIEASLEGVARISSIEYKSSQVPGMVSLSIYSNKDEDIREEVFYALSAAKCPIMDMQSNSMSLEDIFLEVTENQNDSKQSKEQEGQEHVSNI